MRTIYFIVFMLFTSTLIYSQVTIGSGIAPNKGALLDLKENNATTGANSTRGLLLPRVNLTHKNSLIDIADISYEETAVQIAHAGLVVYNINEKFDKGEGLHIWDGTKWISFEPDTIKTTIERIVYSERSYFMGMSNSDVSILDLSLLDMPSAWTIFSYNNVYINTESAYNTNTGIFKVKDTGTYNIFARYQTAGLNILGYLGLGILIKRTTDPDQKFKVLTQDSYVALLATGESREVYSGDIQLNAGDEIVFAITKANLLTLTVASSNGSYAVIKQK